jgi:hypothetical protein
MSNSTSPTVGIDKIRASAMRAPLIAQHRRIGDRIDVVLHAM